MCSSRLRNQKSRGPHAKILGEYKVTSPAEASEDSEERMKFHKTSCRSKSGAVQSGPLAVDNFGELGWQIQHLPEPIFYAGQKELIFCVASNPSVIRGLWKSHNHCGVSGGWVECERLKISSHMFSSQGPASRRCFASWQESCDKHRVKVIPSSFWILTMTHSRWDIKAFLLNRG